MAIEEAIKGRIVKGPLIWHWKSISLKAVSKK